ncbi:MAG: CvpA family protein [Gluconobacter albidus]
MPPLPDLSHITPADLTRLDLVALGIMALSALWGLTRGFATELAGLLAWVGAIVLTYRFHGLLEPYLAPYLHQAALAGSASTAILFVVVLLVFTMIGARVGAAARAKT